MNRSRSSSNKTFSLTYFNAQGRAELIRLIFAMAQVPFEDIRISYEQWAELKKTLPLAHLPFLKVHDLVTGEEMMLFRSCAIARYLAKLFNLAGSTPRQELEADEAFECLRDVLDLGADVIMERDSGRKAELVEKIRYNIAPKTFRYLEQKVVKFNGRLTSSDTYTYAELALTVVYGFVRRGFIMDISPIDLMAELTHAETSCYPAIDADHPNLSKLENAVSEIPQITAYLARRPDTPF